MSTYSRSRRVNDPSHPLDGRLRDYYRGLAPRTRCILTTLAWRGGTINLKKLNLGVILTNPSLYLDSRRRARFHQLSAHCTSSSPRSTHARAPSSHVRGLSVQGKHHWSRVLGNRWHLMPVTTGRGHRRPSAPDYKYLSIGIHPIAAWHNNISTGTRIITMITLTPDKLALVKTVFSIRIPVYQEFGRSTPRQMAHPRGFTPPPPKDGPKPRRPIRYDDIGQRLSEGSVPLPVSHSL
jgi:hypothetical protein